MPSIITRGAGSAQALGYAARATAANYIEDVFSTYLYTGNGSTQTITNGIDLSTKGGLVWLKSRSTAYDHKLHDTARGITKWIASNSSAVESDSTTGGVTSANSDGFSLGNFNGWNASGQTFASWTFRKQAKFFDIVTYSGDGTNNRQINHNLGSTPGCVIIKCRSHADKCVVWHRNLSGTDYALILSGALSGSAQTNVQDPGQSFSSDGSVQMSSTQFVVSTESGDANSSGKTYVAYLFAHDAGGFGASGTDNVISCGSFTTNGSGNATVNLGYEPQWVLVKASSATGSWFIVDQMRGFTVSSAAISYADSDGDEGVTSGLVVNSTGFGVGLSTSTTYIYIAIRRGPMKTPMSGTNVYKSMYGTAGTPSFTSTFPVDMIMDGTVASTWEGYIGSRIQGGNLMYTNQTVAETSAFSTNMKYDYSYGFGTSAFNSSHFSFLFSRAPGFFDVVCYTGDATANRKITHNLKVAPELLIVKKRSSSTFGSWRSYAAPLGATKSIDLNSDAAAITYSIWNDTAPTSEEFTVQTNYANSSGDTFVAYLFATVAGVSKVGSYTGTGTTKQIDCGFTGGARFVMIKRTDSTGDWYVWDSTRGIVSGNDPYLRLNVAEAHVTTTDYVDTYSAGFEISSTAPAAINANGGTFIFLAIA